MGRFISFLPNEPKRFIMPTGTTRILQKTGSGFTVIFYLRLHNK